jgi:hypothetical protein
MPVDYDRFRTKPWAERVTLFNAISAEEKAELVRTHISRWVAAHRQDLTPAQLEVADEWMTFVKPDSYVFPKSEKSMSLLKALEARTAVLFSREQMREALTMHWDQSSQLPRQ